MTHNRPTVSLVVPAYNAAGTLPECLAAIARQRFKPLEVIVLDDGSTDATGQIARKAGVRLVRHAQNRGLAAARNTAIRAAKGELVAALDSDLVAPPQWLGKMVRNFQSRRRIAGCCGRVVERYTRTIADRWRAVHMKLDFGQRRSYKPRWLFCGISLIRRDAIIEAGMFDERCRTAYDDVDMSKRLTALGHTLLYDPTAVAWHLKRSRPGDVVRGFWSYWAAKNEMQGAYKSLATAAKLMIERQMGIVAYRIRQDLRHRRDELLPLDTVIPLAFCVRDLEHMVRLGSLRREQAWSIQRELAQCWRGVWNGGLQMTDSDSMASLAFAGGRMPDGQSARPAQSARRYVETFANALGKLFTGLPAASRRRISREVPALLREARVEGRTPENPPRPRPTVKRKTGTKPR